MTSSASGVIRIETPDLSVASFDWSFARDHRAEIDDHFEMARLQKPALWNGRVLLMHEHAVEDTVLRGRYFETDFASFMAWRDFGFPDTGVVNGFALGALQGSDGGFVLGVMGAQTANAGKVYFPGGTPDPSDMIDGRVDLDSSVRREVVEETGLDLQSLDIDSGWHCIPSGPLLALLKPMRARETAEQMREHIAAHIAADPKAELAGAFVVRSLADLDTRMPAFIQTFFRAVYADPKSFLQP